MKICAAAGEIPIVKRPSTASVATRAMGEPWCLRRTGVAVPRTARVCELLPWS
jgi:hypothetical protein